MAHDTSYPANSSTESNSFEELQLENSSELIITVSEQTEVLSIDQFSLVPAIELSSAAKATISQDLDARVPEINQALQQSPLLGQSNAPEVDTDEWPEPVEDSQVFSYFLIDQLEYRFNEGEDTFNWDAIGWVGGDYQRLWIKTEGDVGLNSDDGEAELQLLYGRLIAPFWDFQAGIRYDQVYSSEGGPGRAFGVIGFQGLAPYLFEIDSSLFVSQEGDISARFTAEYQFLLTQQLILQPEFETNIALQKVEEFGVGSGLNDIELGLRLRYEINRRFAPYLGISWTQKFGETANFAREDGEEVSNFAVVGGFRFLF
ncbi:copper resistance protein B [Nodosilinea sp. LEGE 07088]|nr:copper resistance protein B [Nodosilinea sp. LEGE 07088]